MANYAYITLEKPTNTHDFTKILVEAKDAALGPRWRVRLASFAYDGPTWIVELPETLVLDEKEANRRLLAPGENVGFVVSIDEANLAYTVAFRHSMNRFERWAQGCLEEELADRLGVGVTYDATDETRPPGTRLYRVGTFYEFITREFDKPLSEEDRKYLDERFADLAPEGFWP